MKPATVAPIPWGALRIEYARTWARSLKAFAEQHDAPYKALCKRAKREGWQRLRSLEFARQRVRESEAELDFVRKVAARAGRYVVRLSRAADLPLKDLAIDTWHAHFAVSALWSAAALLIEARRELAELQGGRDPHDASAAARDRTGGMMEWRPDSAWPRFNVLAYRQRGPAAVPKRLTPKRLAVRAA